MARDSHMLEKIFFTHSETCPSRGSLKIFFTHSDPHGGELNTVNMTAWVHRECDVIEEEAITKLQEAWDSSEQKDKCTVLGASLLDGH